MEGRRKISIALCLFLTIAPLLGSCIHDETVGEFVGNLTPYIGLTISQVDGMPFADAFGALFALIFFIFGATSLIVFAATKFRNTTGLKAFLVITVVYCGSRGISGLIFLLFGSTDINTKVFIAAAIFSDFGWAFFCYWAGKNIDKAVLKTAG